MAFDVVACKLRRGPLLIHGVPQAPEEATLDRLFAHSRLRAEVSTRLSAEEAGERVRRWMRDLGMGAAETPVRAGDSRSGRGFFGARHRLQRWGDLVLHVSIVVILAAALMGALFGFVEILPIPVGGTVPLKHRPLQVTLEDFDIHYYAKNGAVSRYASLVSIRQSSGTVEAGGQLARKWIIVNDPLDLGRIRFYQAAWGMTNQFRSAVLRLGQNDVTVRPDEVMAIGGTGLSVRARRIVPTFEVSADGRLQEGDFHGQNPAILLDFLEHGELRVSVWLLYNRPQAWRVEGDRLVPAPPPPFTWVGFDPVLFSGIQVGYDPGAPLFWFGAACLMVGLCSHFYLHQRRLRVAVLPRPEGSEILIGGWNSRTPSEFEPEFESWVERLRRSIA
jgi:cytochrome c biogenesis protein